MKPNTKIVQLIAAAFALSLFASFLHARGPNEQTWRTLRDPSQFKKLKTSDEVAFVCNGCQTISEVEIKSPEFAYEIHKEDGLLECPACHMPTKIVIKREGNEQLPQIRVKYVNDKGEERAFLVIKPKS